MADGAAHLAGLRRHNDVGGPVHLRHRRLDDLGVQMLEHLVIGTVTDPHQSPKQLQLPPTGAARPHKAIAILIERQRVPARKPPLNVKVDQRKDLRIVQLFSQGGRIGILAHPALQLGIGQQTADPPLLLTVGIQHVPLGQCLHQPAQRRLQRFHVIRVIPNHRAKRARIDPVRRLMDQRVIGVQQQDIRKLPLQQRQLAAHVNGGDVLLDRPAPQGTRQFHIHVFGILLCHRSDSFGLSAEYVRKGTLRQQMLGHLNAGFRCPVGGCLSTKVPCNARLKGIQIRDRSHYSCG